ncbi:HD domain-containing protein [Arthrobacter sp. NPDC057388]|uniref:HD domain-containing protein n=1 Tax=Arthrobacter sp. NPDC057388 TaxID=3346116 RepID=UPI00363353CF
MTTLTTTRVPLKHMDPAMLVFELEREIQRLMPGAVNTELVTGAAATASFLHRKQTRFVRGDMPRVPYIEHPLRVALRLLRWGVTDAELIAAALLHDVVEDCSEELLAAFGQPGENALGCLARRYGRRVSVLVGAVTTPNGSTSYEEHLTRLANSGSRAMLIKASDLKDNAGSIRHQLGHGQDSRMYRMLFKYMPAVEIVGAGLRHSLCCPATQQCTMAAISAMEDLSHDLAALSAEHGID